MIEKPSRTFLIRGAIAFCVLIIVFAFQTDVVRNLFSKKEVVSQKNIESLEELIQKDSNANGIPDWEERFWGLDPEVASTNGQPHTTIIAERRTILSSRTNAENLTETDRLARELFISATIVGGSTDGDLGTIRAVSEQAADQFTQGRGLIDEITASQTTRISTNKTTISEYLTTLVRVLESKQSTNELEIIALVSEQKKMEELPKLIPISTSYKSLADRVAKIPVPTALAEEHMILANSINNMGRGLETFQTIKTDTVMGLIGFYQYSAEEERFEQTLDSLIEKSNSYFIIP
jgi:hypothetical protein